MTLHFLQLYTLPPGLHYKIGILSDWNPFFFLFLFWFHCDWYVIKSWHLICFVTLQSIPGTVFSFWGLKDPKPAWAAAWQNQQNECAPSEDSDQPGHLLSLIRVFAVYLKKPWVFSYPLSTQRRLWLDGWSESFLGAHSFVGFVMLWLTCCISLCSSCSVPCTLNYQSFNL